MVCIKKVTFQDICSVDPLWKKQHNLNSISFAMLFVCYKDVISKVV